MLNFEVITYGFTKENEMTWICFLNVLTAVLVISAHWFNFTAFETQDYEILAHLQSTKYCKLCHGWVNLFGIRSLVRCKFLMLPLVTAVVLVSCDWSLAPIVRVKRAFWTRYHSYTHVPLLYITEEFNSYSWLGWSRKALPSVCECVWVNLVL